MAAHHVGIMTTLIIMVAKTSYGLVIDKLVVCMHRHTKSTHRPHNDSHKTAENGWRTRCNRKDIISYYRT